MLKVLFKRGQVVINSRIRFFQIGFFKQFGTARTDQCGRWQLTSPSILQHKGFDVGSIECAIVIGLSDCINDSLTPIEMRQVNDASQVCGCPDRLTSQFKMKPAGFFAECIERIFNVICP